MKKLLATTLVASTLFTGAVFAGDHHKGGKNDHFGKGRMGPAKIYRKLDLTEDQKTQLKTIFDSVKPADQDRDALKVERKAQMEKRRAIIEADTLDVNAVNQMASQHAQKAQERFTKMIEAEHKAWQLLTPEQKTKAKEIMEKRAERMEKRSERGEKRKGKKKDD